MFRVSMLVAPCAAAMILVVLSGCAATGDKAGAGAASASPWRLAMMTYTFREFTFFEAVDKSKTLDVKYLEAHSWQKLSADLGEAQLDPTAPPAALEATKRKLSDAGLKLVGYYFHNLGKDDAETRKVFEFCRDMGIEYIVCEPEPGKFEMLDRLAAEHDVNVAVHNHPKDAKHPEYVNWNPLEVLKQIKGRSKCIGTCADTGHWVRSGVDPVEALRKYQGRTLCLHLKDIERPEVDSRDVPWGTGIGKTRAILAELKREKFAGVFSIEYEHNPKDNIQDVAECIRFFNSTAKELGIKGYP